MFDEQGRATVGCTLSNAAIAESHGQEKKKSSQV
jgi:hypothetical protein